MNNKAVKNLLVVIVIICKQICKTIVHHCNNMKFKKIFSINNVFLPFFIVMYCNKTYLCENLYDCILLSC